MDNVLNFSFIRDEKGCNEANYLFERQRMIFITASKTGNLFKILLQKIYHLRACAHPTL